MPNVSEPAFQLIVRALRQAREAAASDPEITQQIEKYSKATVDVRHPDLLDINSER
jgi:hypothetical protein